MRLYTKEYTTQEVISLMHQLSDPKTGVPEYRDAFYQLGKIMGLILDEVTLKEYGNTMLACTSEDADWLAKGVLDSISPEELSLSVFWNDRVKLVQTAGKVIEISPIVKSYVEPIKNCKTLILVKSIISTSCVVKTQLTALIDHINPDNIYIIAPVMFKNAHVSLYKEFPHSISEKFRFITLAIDDRKNDKGEILPGIGGMVYPRLGLGNMNEKNNYIPEIVKRKMASDYK